MENEYYVYAWYYISTNKIFYIGKGKGNRYKETNQSRNDFFKNIVNKYSSNVAVKKLVENLTNEEACKLERQLIKEYKCKNECEANFHEGGLGGNTGNYSSKDRHDKLSKFAKTRIRALNSNYGKHWTEEQRLQQSEKLKKIWQDPKKKTSMLKNRDYKNRIVWNKGTKGLVTSWNKGKKLSKEHYLKMMNADCRYKYEVYYEEKLIYWCLGKNLLNKFCKNKFNISRAIVKQLINNTWQPKFNKHKYLFSLKIIIIDRSVSTIRDECSEVEWRLQPFEVPGNLN